MTRMEENINERLSELGTKILATTRNELYIHCLLYTSDAADEEDSVDLGGRRIIKKKNNKEKKK